jgi:hypothetical protein
MVRIVIETTYDQPFTDEDWNTDSAKVIPCLEQRGARWIRSLVSSDRRRSVCEFEAPDAEAIRESYRRVGIGFDRMWIAEIHEP